MNEINRLNVFHSIMDLVSKFLVSRAARENKLKLPISIKERGTGIRKHEETKN